MYELTRNYDTDLSRTDVKTLLENITHRLVSAKGEEIPTKNAYETPDVVDENDNRFEVAIRPTVTDAGFEATDLLATLNYDGHHVRLLGIDSSGDRETVQLRVKKGESHLAHGIEKFEEMREV